ncbi:MAG: hypothetical protein OXC46_03110 [Thaumarchaeota archaeon]|nr:hypothetical protein [Nitrososphaerota archaeon]
MAVTRKQKQLPASTRTMLVKQAMIIHDLYRPAHIMEYVNLMRGKGTLKISHKTIKADVESIRNNTDTQYDDMTRYGIPLKITETLTDIFKEITALKKNVEMLIIPDDYTPGEIEQATIDNLKSQDGKIIGAKRAAIHIERALKAYSARYNADAIATLNDQLDKKRQLYLTILAAYPLAHAIKSITESQGAQIPIGETGEAGELNAKLATN